MNECLIVGEAPSRTSDPTKPLMLASLASLADLQFPHQWRAAFDRINLLPAWPGAKPGGGSKFPTRRGRQAASELRATLTRYRYVVLLGKRVARAFHPDLVTRRWFEWGAIPSDDAEALARLERVKSGLEDPNLIDLGPQCALAPHPSRCSRWWNDSRNCLKARKWWTNLARELHGETK